MSEKHFLTCAAPIVCVVPNLPILKRPYLYCLRPSSKFCTTPSLCYFLPCFFGTRCVVLFSNIMDLNLLSVGTLVLAAPWYVFYGMKSPIYHWFDTDDMIFATAMTWYHKHWQTNTGNTGTNTFTHIYKYTFTAPVMCPHQLPILHWMNNFPTYKFNIQRSTMSLLFKKYYNSLVEVIHLLNTFN